jgi:hypothetical protein
MMRPRLLGSLLAFSLAALPVLPQTASHAAPGNRECTVVTTGYERPEWFCRFYTEGPITFTAASASGWTIRRLIKQYNNGNYEFVELAGKKGVIGPVPPVDVQRGTLNTPAGWYIEIAVLSSTTFDPLGRPLQYRNGILDARTL